MISFHRIAARLYGQPLLILPATAQTIESFVRGRMREGEIDAGRGGRAGNERSAETIEFFAPTQNGSGGQEGHTPRASRFVGSTPLDASGRPMPFRRTPDGTAIITIVGELVNRGAWIGASSGLVSYEGITHQLRSAAADPMTRSILLDIESPGGEAVGAFECAAAVRKAREAKPVVAIVNGMAASAGYAIASGATQIVTTPTGLSGSIGVVMMHLDYSEMLAGAGIKPTFIFAGDHKVDGNPYEPLPDAVRADFKREIDAFYRLFLQTVADGRGARLSADMARATQARVLMGEEAVRAGLADQVMTFDETLAWLARRHGSAPKNGGPAAAAGPLPSSNGCVSPIVAAARQAAAAAHAKQAEQPRGNGQPPATAQPPSPAISGVSPIVAEASRRAAEQLARAGGRS